MPIHRTTKDRKPAIQYGTHGAKYTYTAGNKASREAANESASSRPLPSSDGAGCPRTCNGKG